MVKKWSHKVTKGSDALDLEKSVFTWRDPHRIALSLKRSAEQSTRRQAGPYQPCRYKPAGRAKANFRKSQNAAA